MKLISVQRYRLDRFEAGSAPHENTIRRLIRERQLPGRRIGARYFIDESALPSTVERLVAKVCSDVRRSP
ncbi:MAG: hypothetical protein ISP90_08065 [Nevskia sp.]|nr:hypothetical protein [Nevskia sp.]